MRKRSTKRFQHNSNKSNPLLPFLNLPIGTLLLLFFLRLATSTFSVVIHLNGNGHVWIILLHRPGQHKSFVVAVSGRLFVFTATRKMSRRRRGTSGSRQSSGPTGHCELRGMAGPTSTGVCTSTPESTGMRHIPGNRLDATSSAARSLSEWK